METLVAAGADPNTRSTDTPLLCATMSEKAVALLLASGADPNTCSTKPNRLGESPLIAASQFNKTKVVKALLEAGADPVYVDPNGRTALQAAQDFSAKRTIAVLEKAITATVTDAEDLHQAVAIKSATELERLLTSGHDVNATKELGRTALHQAALAGWLEGVKKLLDAGASVDPVDDREATPIMRIAKGRDGASIADALICAGADIHRKTSQGWTPLHQAEDFGVVRALLAAGADPNEAFQYACLLRSPDVIEAMIDAGAVLDERALTWARGNRAGKRYLEARLGRDLSESDRVRHALRQISKKARDEDFIEWTNRLSEALNRKPAAWKRRKGAVYLHNVSIHRIIAYLAETEEVAPDNAFGALAALSEHARSIGYTLFAVGYDAIDNETIEQLPIVILPISEPLAPLLLCGTNRNDGGDAAELLNILHKIAESEPFNIIACGHDYLSAGFVKEVSAPEMFARQLLDICPDIADQAEASLRNAEQPERENIISRSLVEDGYFLLWWD
ncbi:MAG: ankyrin repeat domain-containing protein [Henriciella sp.]|nr:ankyrin repeat domain-containing protein [Henriciella sp.]